MSTFAAFSHSIIQFERKNQTEAKQSFSKTLVDGVCGAAAGGGMRFPRGRGVKTEGPEVGNGCLRLTSRTNTRDVFVREILTLIHQF